MKSGVETIDAEQICIERVGEKAFGLASLPAKWTLPFFVISDELFDDYTKAGTANDLMTAWGYAISLAAAQCKIELDDQIIVRSNAHSEGLENRGKFISVEGTLREWPQLVKRCFDDFIAQEGSSNVRMPVIIQKRVISLFCGHISNERRVAKDLRDWRGEFDVVAPPRTFRISLRNWRKKVNTTDQFNSKLMCPSDRNIRTALTIPCTWVTSQKIRVHFEWVYDGDYLYLVQADEEKSSSGIDPTKLSCKSEEGNKSTDRNFPHCLRMLRAEDTERYKQYAKIQNPLLFRHFDKIHKIPREELPFWIISIVKNEALSIIRKRQKTVSLENWDGYIIESENVLDYTELVNLFAKLPLSYRSVLEMKILLGYSDKEIATHLGISETAVSTRASRGRTLLREIIRKEGFSI